MLTLLLLVTAQASAADEMAKLVPAITTGMDAYVKEARKLSGSVMIYNVTEGKKAERGYASKSDGSRYLLQILNGEKKTTHVELYRTFGDIRHAIYLQQVRTGGMLIQDESFRKKGEPAFDIENSRVFAYDSPACMALRPIPGYKLTMLDILDYQSIEVTKVENTTIDNIKVVKITYQYNKEKNESLDPSMRMSAILGGWVALRPDQHYTILKSEFTLASERRRPSRSWKADYVYEPGTGPFQTLKEIQLATIDQSKEKPDLKLTKQLFEFDFKPNKEPLTDKDFSMAQFGAKERTAADWLAEVAAKEKEEAEEKAKIAALPPSALKPSSSGLNVSPWAILVGGFAAFIILVMWVIWSTSKPARVAPAADAAPANPSTPA